MLLDEWVRGFGPGSSRRSTAAHRPTVSSVTRVVSADTSTVTAPARRSQRDVNLGHVEHHRVVAAHGRLREGRHQELVGLVPVRLVVVGGEQPVATQEAQRLQVATLLLAQLPFVIEVGDQVGTGDDDL